MARVDAEAPDEILVVAAILGDLTAFDELVLRYRPAVVRTVQAIVPVEDVEDVAQDALLLAFKALPSLEEPKKFPSWLYAIARRCAIRFSQRTRSRQRALMILDEALLEQVPAIGRTTPDHGAEEELRNMLGGLPPDYALALRLHFFDGMPLKRIASFLGVTLAIVKWRIYRGKILLRIQLKENKRRNKKWREKKK